MKKKMIVGLIAIIVVVGIYFAWPCRFQNHMNALATEAASA